MKRLTIVVPDSVAERAQATGNASRWFSTAGLRMMGAEEYLIAGLEHLAAAGVQVTDDGVAAAGRVVKATRAATSPEDWAVLRRGPEAARARKAGTDTTTAHSA